LGLAAASSETDLSFWMACALLNFLKQPFAPTMLKNLAALTCDHSSFIAG